MAVPAGRDLVVDRVAVVTGGRVGRMAAQEDRAVLVEP